MATQIKNKTSKNGEKKEKFQRRKVLSLNEKTMIVHVDFYQVIKIKIETSETPFSSE